MPVRRALLPREGFTADVVAGLIKKTALNPALTLPLVLYAYYHRKGQDLRFRHPTAFKRLNLLLYLGLARWANRFLNQGVLNNWQADKYDWSKEIVLVTGGSDGIGKALVLLLASRGIKTIVLDIRPLTFEDTTSLIHYYPCDITSASAVTSTATTIRATHGAPTILINNAGVAHGTPILTSTDASNHRTLSVNLLSHFRLVREFLPAMLSANHGMIVTIASLAAHAALPLQADYAASKAGALAFHEVLAAELKIMYEAPKVRTVCVLPYWVRTEMARGYEQKDAWLVPVSRVETVAEAILEKVLSGGSGMVVVPPAAEWLGLTSLRAWPVWVQALARRAGGEGMRTWTGRTGEGVPGEEQGVPGGK